MWYLKTFCGANVYKGGKRMRPRKTRFFGVKRFLLAVRGHSGDSSRRGEGLKTAGKASKLMLFGPPGWRHIIYSANPGGCVKAAKGRLTPLPSAGLHPRFPGIRGVFRKRRGAGRVLGHQRSQFSSFFLPRPLNLRMCSLSFPASSLGRIS